MSRKSSRGNSAHFLALRRRLDAMGYTDFPLGLDSAPLAQIMLEDLVATTEALRDSEESSGGVLHRLEIAEQLLEPLQEENSRIRRDNVQLHQKMITVGEKCLKLENKLSSTQFSLQAEIRRLSMSKESLESELEKAKNDLLQTKAQLQQALEPLLSSQNTSENRSRRLKSHGSRSQLSDNSSVRSSLANISFGGNDNTELQKEIEELKSERDAFASKLEEANNTVNELKQCLKIRDDEINRLGEELQKETGKDGYLITLRYKYQKAEDEIEKLRTQVRLINPKGLQVTKKKTKGKRFTFVSGDFVSVYPDTKAKSPKSETPKSSRNSTPQSSPQVNQQMVRELEESKQQIIKLSKQIEEKDNLIAEMAADFAFIGDNVQGAIVSKLKQTDISTMNEIEKQLNHMRNYYESEIDRLRKQIDGFSMTSNSEVAKLMASTSGLDSSYSPNSISEEDSLRRQLKEANEKLKSIPDTEKRYQTIIEQLKQEYAAMKTEIRAKDDEIRVLKSNK